MKPYAKLNLSKLGLSTLEVDAVEKLVDSINSLDKEEKDMSFAKDQVERNKKINDKIGEEFSLSTQIAILRKAIYSLGCIEPTFIAFNERVEEIKREIDQEAQ